MGGAQGWAKAGVKGARGSGIQFSHGIPERLLKLTKNRWIIKKFGLSKFNGNYVSKMRHYKHDLYAHGNIMGESKNWGPRWPFLIQQFDRVPRLYYGLAAGFGYGYGHHVLGAECAE